MARHSFPIKEVLVCILSFMLCFVVSWQHRAKAVLGLQIQDVNLQNLRDGTYTGVFVWFQDFTQPIEMHVQVENHKITDITVSTELSPLGKKMVGGLIKRVLEAQTPNIQPDSDSPHMSKCVLKAIENALNRRPASRPFLPIYGTAAMLLFGAVLLGAKAVYDDFLAYRQYASGNLKAASFWATSNFSFFWTAVACAVAGLAVFTVSG